MREDCAVWQTTIRHSILILLTILFLFPTGVEAQPHACQSHANFITGTTLGGCREIDNLVWSYFSNSGGSLCLVDWDGTGSGSPLCNPQDVSSYCGGLSEGGYSWRVPTATEMTSVCSAGAPTAFDSNFPSRTYISSTLTMGSKSVRLVTIVGACGTSDTLLNSTVAGVCVRDCCTTAVDYSFFRAVIDRDQGTQLDWITTFEEDILGFSVERAPSEVGPWTAISGTIPALGFGFGSAYEFLDSATRDQQMYYRLEEINIGANEYYGPIISRFPEQIRAEEEALNRLRDVTSAGSSGCGVIGQTSSQWAGLGIGCIVVIGLFCTRRRYKASV